MNIQNTNNVLGDDDTVVKMLGFLVLSGSEISVQFC